jgi:phage recombination protein Bet
MSTEVATTSSNAELTITPDQLALIKRTVLKPKNREATDDELALFSHQASRTGLDPMARQIYGVFRYDNRIGGEVMSIQVSIDGFRLVAQRSGRYLGQTPVYWCGPDLKWVEVWNSSAAPVAAKVGVYVQGAPEPTWGVARFEAYAQKQSPMWKRMGDVMIAKCAEALALRKAFPAELSGLYTSDEMDQSHGDTPPAPSQVEPRPVDTLAAMMTERGFSPEDKAGIAEWLRSEPERKDEKITDAIALLEDGDNDALRICAGFDAEPVKAEVVK